MTVPKGWANVQMGTMATIQKGYTYKSADLADSGVPFVTIKCFDKGGGFRIDGLKALSEMPDGDFVANAGDILLANTDLTRDGDIIGSVLRVPEEVGQAVLSMDVSRIDVDRALADRSYVYYMLSGDQARRFMKAHSSGSTVLHLKTSDIPRWIVPLPPLPEQRKIAAILSSVDRAIAANLSVALGGEARSGVTLDRIAGLRRLKAGLLQDLLTGTVRVTP